jgi:hypothetical protein
VEALYPNHVWQSDMTKVWAGPSVGWAYLVSVIDCCTRGGPTESGPQLVEVDLPLNKNFRAVCASKTSPELAPTCSIFRAVTRWHDRKTSASQCVADVRGFYSTLAVMLGQGCF